MSAFFSARPVDHPELGRLVRRGGRWRGNLAIDGFPTFGLSLPGNRRGPDPAATALVGELRSRWPALAPLLAAQLFDHYGPYQQAREADAGRGEEDVCPEIDGSDGVWPHVSELIAAVHPKGGGGDILFGFNVTWDLEHTLGATVRNWTITEFSGSIGAFEL